MTQLLILLLALSPASSFRQGAQAVAAGGGGGGGITFHGAEEGNFSVTQSPVVNYPAGVQANDVSIIIFQSGAHDSSGTPPAGVTKIGSDVDGADGSMSVFWKRHSGADTSDTFTDIFAAAELGTIVVVTYRGVVTTGDPIDVTLAESPAAGTAKDIAATTLSANVMCVGIFGGPNATASAYTVASDVGQDERVVDTTTPDGFVDAGNCQITVSDLIRASAGLQNMGIDWGTSLSGNEVFIGLKPQ